MASLRLTLGKGDDGRVTILDKDGKVIATKPGRDGSPLGSLAVKIPV